MRFSDAKSSQYSEVKSSDPIEVTKITCLYLCTQNRLLHHVINLVQPSKTELIVAKQETLNFHSVGFR